MKKKKRRNRLQERIEQLELENVEKVGEAYHSNLEATRAKEVSERLKEALAELTEPAKSFYTVDIYEAMDKEIMNSNLCGLTKSVFVRFLRAAKNGKFIEDPSE